MKPKFLLLASVVLALAGLTASCKSKADPYGINSPGYYGSNLDAMSHNLVRPGSASRR